MRDRVRSPGVFTRNRRKKWLPMRPERRCGLSRDQIKSRPGNWATMLLPFAPSLRQWGRESRCDSMPMAPGCSVAEAARAIEAFASVARIAWVEQPLPRHDLDGCGSCGSEPLCRSWRQLELSVVARRIYLARGHAADVFNVYVVKAGGLERLRRFFGSAIAVGIPCILGARRKWASEPPPAPISASPSLIYLCLRDIRPASLLLRTILRRPFRFQTDI